MTTNGDLPDDLLVPAAGTPGARLRAGAAQRWGLIRDRVHAQFGWWPTLTSAGDAYRSLQLQTAIFLDRYDHTWRPGRTPANGGIKSWRGQTWYRKPGKATAASPGTSNHGYGKAVDVTGLGGFDGARYTEFAQVALAIGFTNTEGRSIGEAWHWVDQHDPDVTTASNPIGTGGTVPVVPNLPGLDPLTPIEEDDMPSMNEFANYLMNYPAYDGGPTVSQTLKDLASVPAGLRAIPADVWATTVQRGDEHVPALQELADAKTLGQAILTRDNAHADHPIDVTALAALLVDSLDDDLADAVADLLSKRLES